MVRIAVYAGSFDPFTKGHLDIVHRAISLFDRVVVVVSHQVKKTYLFSLEERTTMVQQELRDYPQVEVIASQELTVSVARKLGSSVLLRGIRTFGDYELEYNLALANRHLAPEIETVFLLASVEYAFLSSSMVKEMMVFGQDVQSLVGEYTYGELQKKFSS